MPMKQGSLGDFPSLYAGGQQGAADRQDPIATIKSGPHQQRWRSAIHLGRQWMRPFHARDDMESSVRMSLGRLPTTPNAGLAALCPKLM